MQKNHDNRWSRSLTEVVRQTETDLKLSPNSDKIAIKKVSLLSYQKKLFYDGRSPRQQLKCS